MFGRRPERSDWPTVDTFACMRPNFAKRASAVTLVAAGLLLAACGTRAPGPVSFHELRLARSFKPITFYWVGPSFDGISLTSVDDGYDYDPSVGMRVYYGNCDKPNSLLRTSCTLPLQITSVVYVPHSNSALGPRRQISVRGAPAVVYDGGRSIELYTGYLAIDIVADTARRARIAAQRLEPLNAPVPPQPELPQPYFEPGVAGDPAATALATTLRSLPATDTTLTQPTPPQLLAKLQR